MPWDWTGLSPADWTGTGWTGPSPPPPGRILPVRDALAAALAARLPGVAVVPAWAVPEWGECEPAGPTLLVMAGGRGSVPELNARRRTGREYPAALVYAERHPRKRLPPDAWTDQRVRLVEAEVFEPLDAPPNAPEALRVPGLYVDAVTLADPCDPDWLGAGLFLATVTLTLREVK